MQRLRSGLLIFGAALSGLVGCHGWEHPPDSEIIAHFNSHREEFEAFARAASSEPRAISTEDFQEDLRRLGIREVIVSGQGPTLRIWFELSAKGLATSGSIKGVLMSREVINEQVDILNGATVAPGAVGFRRITDGWYLFLER